MTRKLFVTTALPYANAPFHIGHMMEYIQADIWVRVQRLLGHEVHFVCADDAHGAPIMIAAEKAGLTPQDFVAQIAAGRAPVPRRLPDRLRQLAFDRRAGEPCAGAGHLPGAARQRSDRHAHHRAVLRPGEEHVPARPLHQGRMPELRRQGPVRRQLRGLRRGVLAHRPEEPVLGADRRGAGAQAAASTSSSSCRTRAASSSSKPGRRTASCSPRWRTRCASGSPRTRRRRLGPGRLGHQPRRALLRHSDPGRAGQVLLRLAGRAGGLPGVAEEPVRPTRPGLRGLHGRRPRGADPLHRQGHRHLPHAVLAGDAEVQRPQGADQRVRARPPDRRRREDEQEPRHRHRARCATSSWA